MRLRASTVGIWAVSIFFLQNSFAKPPDGRSSSSTSSRSTSSSGMSRAQAQAHTSSNRTTSSTRSPQSSSSSGGGMSRAQAQAHTSSNRTTSSTRSSQSSSSSGGGMTRAQAQAHTSSMRSSSDSGSSNSGMTRAQAQAHTSSMRSSSGSSGSSGGMTRAQAQAHTSSLATGRSAPQMTRAQAQDYTSAMSVLGTRAGIKKVNDAAVLAGFRNAEAGYRGPAEATGLHSGKGYMYEYEKDFFTGVNQYYTRQGLDPSLQSVASGPMQSLLRPHGSRVTAFERKLAADLDAGYRDGKVSISIPGRTFDGKLVSDLTPAQRFALQNTVVVVGDNDFLREHAQLNGAHGFATSQVYTGTGSIGGMVVVGDKGVYFTGETQEEGLENLLHHELDHAADNAILRHSQNLLTRPNLSPADRRLAEEALALTTAITNHTLITQIKEVTLSTGVVAETTAQRIAAISPEFLEKDEYYIRLSEMESYMNHPNMPVESLGTKLFLGANASLTQEEAHEIAQILSESPALELISEVTNSYAQQHLKP